MGDGWMDGREDIYAIKNNDPALAAKELSVGRRRPFSDMHLVCGSEDAAHKQRQTDLYRGLAADTPQSGQDAADSARY